MDNPRNINGDRKELVMALHASASTGRQWSALEERLSARFRTVSPDLGRYEQIVLPIRSGDPGLARRAAPVIRAIEASGGPAHLVGHSFGGAVAVKVASMRPDLVDSLTVYEPALFGLVRESVRASDRQSFRAFQALGSRLTAAVATGEPASGMSHFIDFWNGDGAWARLDPVQKQVLASRAAAVMRDFVDGIYESTAAGKLRKLRVPTLVMAGTQSPEIARRTSHHLRNQIPQARLEVFEGAGHMAPIVEPDRVNRLIAAHLDAVAYERSSKKAAA